MGGPAGEQKEVASGGGKERPGSYARGAGLDKLLRSPFSWRWHV